MSQSPVWAGTRAKVYERDNWTCRYCGVRCRPATGRMERDMATIDHVVPRSRGGSNGADNLVTACFSCNSRKRHKSGAEYGEWTMARFDWEETRL